MKLFKRAISALAVLAIVMGLFSSIPVIYAQPNEDGQEQPTTVSATLGQTPVFDGLTLRMRGDTAWNETPTAGEKDGVGYWMLEPKADDKQNSFYLFGYVDDEVANGGDHYAVLEVTYFDGEGGLFGAAFNTEAQYENWTDTVKLTGTNTWKTHQFVLDGALLNNSLWNGSDFRMGLFVMDMEEGPCMSAAPVMISKVTLRLETRPAPRTSVQATLGAAPVFDGLTLKVSGDGAWNENPASGELDGVGYWTLSPKSAEDVDSFFMYGDVDDDFLYDGSNRIAVKVTYLDSGKGFFSINYSSQTAGENWGDFVQLEDSGSWKTHTFILPDASLKNHCVGRDMDFRLGLYVTGHGMSKAEVKISKVEVALAQREMVSAELGPNPVYDGLTVRVRGDGGWNENPTTGELDGVGYLQLKPEADNFYLFADVDDNYISAGNNCVLVNVTYFDGESGHFSLTYTEPGSAAPVWSDFVRLTGTNTWKTQRFVMRNAAMSSTLFGWQGDFRVGLFVEGHGMSAAPVNFSKITAQKVDAADFDYVVADLGADPVFDGLSMRACGDGAWNNSPKTGELDGRSYWALTPKTDGDKDNFFLFGDVTDDYLYGQTDYVLMDVTYYDGESGHFSLNYRTPEHSEVWGDLVKLEGTKTWKTHTFVLDQAIMTNNHMGKGDFRLGLFVTGAGMSAGEVLISQVKLWKAERPKTVKTTIETTHSGNIFFGSETIDMALQLTSDYDGDNTYTVNYWVKDYNGLVLSSGSWQEHLPEPGTNRAELPFLSDITAYGIYSLDIQVLTQDGEERCRTEFPFSRVRTGTQLDWLGACAHYGQRKSDPSINLPLMNKGGIRFLRDEIYWGSVEKEKGVYDFSPYDRFIDEAVANNIEPLLILDYGNELYGGGAPTTDEAITAFTNYCTALVNHYRGKVKYFEIWNEWNIGLGNVAPEDRGGAAYAKLLVAASKAVREANPDAYILGMAIASTDPKFIGDVLDYPGAYEAMDAVVLHPYTHPRKPEGGVDNNVAIMTGEFESRNLEPLPIWITEMGWPTTNDGTTVSEGVAAGYGVRSLMYTMANADKIDKFFWYDFQNDGVDRSYTEDNFGLIDCWQGPTVPFAAKPGYAAISAFTSVIDGYTYAGQTKLDGAINAFRFTDKTGARQDLLVLFTEGTNETVALSAKSGTVLVTDLFGNENRTSGKDVTVSLSDLPVYLTGDFAEDLTLNKAGFKADGQYTVPAGGVAQITVHRDAEAAKLTGTYELRLPEGWTTTGGTFAAASEATVDRIPVQVPAGTKTGNYTVSLRAIGDNGEVYCSQILTVTVKELQPYVIAPHLESSKDYTDWSVAVTVNHFTAGGRKTGTMKLYNMSADPAQLLGELPYDVEPGGSQTLNFRWPAWGPDTYVVKMVAVDDDGTETVQTKKLSFLAAVERASWQTMTTDGVLDDAEWGDAMEFPLPNYHKLGGDWNGPEDAAAVGYLKWDAEKLYLAIRMTDDEHFQEATGNNIWQGDSIQFSVDPARSTEPGLEGNSQTGFALNGTTGTVSNYQWLACIGRAPGALPEEAFAVTREGTTTTYEAAIPWEAVTNDRFEAIENLCVGFSVLVNDNDGGVRKGFLEYMSGIGLGNNVNQFGDLLLAANDSKQPEVDPTDPEPTDPEPTDPTPTDPTPTDPKPTDPTPTDPKPTDPKPTDPAPTDPQPTQPAQPQNPSTGDNRPLVFFTLLAVFSLAIILTLADELGKRQTR